MNGMNQQRIIMESYIENFSFKPKKKKRRNGHYEKGGERTMESILKQSKVYYERGQGLP